MFGDVNGDCLRSEWSVETPDLLRIATGHCRLGASRMPVPTCPPALTWPLPADGPGTSH